MMIRLRDKDESYIIYEYQEAEEVIRYLAWANKDDITPISRGGRGRNKRYYYKYPCSFDIETTTIRSGELDYWHENQRPIAFPYLYQFNIYGACIFCRQLEEVLDIFRWLGLYFIPEGSRRVLTIWDHNLGYEWGFFKDHWSLVYDKCFAVDEHHPLTLELTSGIILRDSYKISNMGLETLTKDWSRHYIKRKEIMDYTRLRTPYDALDDQTMIYSCLDVLGLSDAMRGYLRAHDTGNWTQCPTSTSFIRREYKGRIGIGNKHRTREQRLYNELLQKCRINYAQYRMLRRQARGGNTHLNRRFTGMLIGEPDGSGVMPSDITSSYPTQMVCYPEYPIGYWMPLDEGCSIKDIKDLERWGYCCLFDVVLINPRIKDDITVPYIPTSKARTLAGRSEYSDNGRYLRGAEYLELTLFGIEWPIIEAQYDIDDAIILRGYFAEKGYLPDILRTFVLDLYAKKTELKGVEGSEVEYALSKAAVNGIYGMAFTNPIYPKWAIDEQGIYLKDQPDPEKELDRHQKSVSYFLPYAWGCMVATLGRVYLQKMIDAVGPDFIYCDTDSVYARDPKRSKARIKALERKLKRYHRRCGLELTYYDIKGRPHELGGIDIEGECSFKSFGAKKYIKVEKGGALTCTIAGVPKAEGAKIIGDPDAFELGMVFPGKDTGKNCLWYIDDEGLTIHDQEGRPIRIYSNIAMLPVDYSLSLSDDYSLCLSVEGINQIYSMDQLHDSMVEDFIN